MSTTIYVNRFCHERCGVSLRGQPVKASFPHRNLSATDNEIGGCSTSVLEKIRKTVIGWLVFDDRMVGF